MIVYYYVQRRSRPDGRVFGEGCTVDRNIPVLKVGKEPIKIEVVSEADVIMTFRGYAPTLKIKTLDDGKEHLLYISARSLAQQLEKRREANGDKFVGLRFAIRKESEERTAQYLVENA